MREVASWTACPKKGNWEYLLTDSTAVRIVAEIAKPMSVLDTLLDLACSIIVSDRADVLNNCRGMRGTGEELPQPGLTISDLQGSDKDHIAISSNRRMKLLLPSLFTLFTSRVPTIILARFLQCQAKYPFSTHLFLYCVYLLHKGFLSPLDWLIITLPNWRPSYPR